MTRERTEGLDREMCDQCGDPEYYDGRAKVWWHSELGREGQIALCDRCGFKFLTAFLSDVIRGGKFTVGDVCDEILMNLQRTKMSHALNRDPYLRQHLKEIVQKAPPLFGGPRGKSKT